MFLLNFILHNAASFYFILVYLGVFNSSFRLFLWNFSTSAGPYFVFVCIYRAQHFQNHSHTSTAVCNSYRHSLYYRDYVGWFYKCFSAHFFNFFCFSFFFWKIFSKSTSVGVLVCSSVYS